MKYYVYALMREDGTPFYIGRGTGRRWLCHECEVRSGRNGGNPAKFEIIKRFLDAGKEVPKEKIAFFNTTRETSQFEARKIRTLGLVKDGGLLVNILPGGGRYRVGKPLSQETRDKISRALRGKPKSKAARKAMSIAKKGRPRDPIASAKAGAKMRGRRLSEEHKKKISASHKGIPLSGAHVAALRGKKRTPEQCANISRSLTGRKLSEAQIAKRHGRPHSEEHRRNISVANTGRKRSEETRAKIRASWIIRKQKSAP